MKHEIELRSDLTLSLPWPRETPPVIALDGSAEPLPARLVGAGAERRAVARLPGWIWTLVPEETGLALWAQPEDGSAPRLHLTRETLQERIEALAATGETPDLPTRLAMLEHAHHGGFLDHLAGPARALCLETARHVLPQAAPGAAAPPAPRPSAGPAAAAKARLAAALQEGRNPLEALGRVLRQEAPGPEAAAEIFLGLLEHLEEAGEVETAFDQLGRPGPEAAGNGRPWTLSRELPARVLLGDTETAAGILARLAAESDLWAITPAVAWAVRLGLARGTTGRDHLEALLRAYLDFLDSRCRGYWDRSACAQLTGCSARLALAGPGLPEPLGRRAMATTLRCHGLSRGFWETLDRLAPGGLQPEPLRTGRAAFATIMARETARPEALEEALRFFDRHGCHGADRVRLEIFGPAGLPGEARLAARMLADLPRPAETALRHETAPGRTATPELAGLAREAARNPAVPADPQAAAQEAASRAAAAALAEARKGAIPTGLDALLRDLGPLAGPRGMGLPLAAALVGGFEAAGAESSARSALEALRDMAGRLPAEALTDSRPLRAAFLRLRAQATVGSAPLSAEAAALCPEPFHQMPPLPVERGTDRMGTAWRRASPVFDTLVVIYSCRAHLETRVESLRKGWVKELEHLGVPYLVVVGDGDGMLEGDVLHLDAPDDYEGLPRKTLSLIDWVFRHTSFTHLFKIDDDCWLDTERLFHTLSYRQFNYYGRRLERKPGDSPRDWHQAKSRSLRGRLEWDKSPEPSVYADGSTGYVLGRPAMRTLLDVLDTPEGARLALDSFAEDKLVGDLLALRGFPLFSDGFKTAILRRSAPGSRPVLRWESGFLPGPDSGTVVAHLDDNPGRSLHARRIGAPGFAPKRVWPTHLPARTGFDSRTMELVSEESRLAEANRAEVAVLSVVRNEMFMLPHFLAHYRRLGVEGFLIVDNLSDDGTLDYLMAQPDVAVFSTDSPFSRAAQGTDWKIGLMQNFRIGRWSLVADSDEFLVHPGFGTETLPQVLAGPDFAGADAVRLAMLDMYPEGDLCEATFTSGDPFAEAGFADRVALRRDSLSRGPFSDSRTRTSALRHRLLPGSRTELFVAEKVPLLCYQPWMRISVSMHYATGVSLAAREMLFAHFKYNAEFHAKAEREIRRGQYFNGAEEYRKYMALATEGRDRLFDPAHSVPWQQSDVARAVLGDGEGSL